MIEKQIEHQNKMARNFQEFEAFCEAILQFKVPHNPAGLHGLSDKHDQWSYQLAQPVTMDFGT